MKYYRISEPDTYNLYNTIRDKTGFSDKLTIHQAIIDVASIPIQPRNIPDYVQNEVNRVSNVVLSRQSDNCINFINISDMHIQPVTTEYRQQLFDGILHAAQAIFLLKEKLPILFTTILGDYAYGAYNDTEDDHRNNLINAVKINSIINPDFKISGNHDTNPYNADICMTSDEIYKYLHRFDHNANIMRPAIEPNRGYYHIDYSDKNLRVICLNTADLDDVPYYDGVENKTNYDGNYVSNYQLKWLIETLSNIENGWNVLILSHHPIHWGSLNPDQSNSMNNVLHIIESYMQGLSGSVTDTISSEEISYDFSNCNRGTILGNIHGHTHNFIYGKIGDLGINYIGTPNACQDRTNEYGTVSSYPEDFRSLFGDSQAYYKSGYSASDTSFCITTIDFTNKKIYSTHYGAGIDREIDYSDSQYFQVYTELQNVYSDGLKYAKNNDEYTCTLTAIDNYELSDVHVYMNDEDITERVYSNGIIQIANVSGHIRIVASATYKAIEYSNLVSTSLDDNGTAIFNGNGYMDNYTIGDGGEPYASNGCIMSGWMPSSASFYIKGLQKVSDVTFVISVANKAGDDIAIYYGMQDAYVNYEYLGNGVYKINLLSDIYKYMRIAGIAANSDFIVTTTDISSIPDSNYDISIDIDNIGYNDGNRWSTSSGNLSGVAGFTAINPIEFNDITTGDSEILVRLSGNVDWTYNTNCTFVCYYHGASNNDGCFGGYLNEEKTYPSQGYDVIHNNDGSVFVRLYNASNNTYDSIYAIAVSGHGNGADAIIEYSLI